MGQWLQQHRPETAKILVSPTLRTPQTANALQRKVRLVPELGPEETLDDLLHCTRWPDARGPMVMVGHQAALGLTAAYLLAGLLQRWPIGNGAVWWLRRRQRQGQTQVVLHTVLSIESL